MNKNQELALAKKTNLTSIIIALHSNATMTSREIAEIIGVSRPLVNAYLNELEANGHVRILGTTEGVGPGRKAFIWGIARKPLHRPWYRRILDWLTGDYHLTKCA